MSTALETHDGPATCENCATPLQGHYCHQCGQTAHNPLRNVRHAIEEVFESFWHLDGRIFRTLRDIWAPGRLANRYLSGHRAPYIAPLRLFVIVSVLTFFVAQFAISFGDTEEAAAETPTSERAQGGPRIGGNPFRDAKTVEEVIRDRDQAIEGFEEGKAASAGVPGVAAAMNQSMRTMRQKARERIAEIDPNHPELSKPDADESTHGSSSSSSSASPSASASASSKSKDGSFMERWLQKKNERFERNLERYNEDPEALKHAFFSSIPTALFFLVPIFAIFLKLAYIETPRAYLEHLVVALYSHAWLCLALLLMFALFALNTWITPHASWFGIVIGVLEFCLWWWMPIYLLLMQKRVYRQAWWLTILKYLIIGTVYFVMVTFAAAFVGINSLIA